jgi:hypothetical protein
MAKTYHKVITNQRIAILTDLAKGNNTREISRERLAPKSTVHWIHKRWKLDASFELRHNYL